jgi:O-antigen ligase
MTLTGRTRIWPVVIQLWLETPVFGRGFGSSLYILPTHPDLFLAAASAHSLYLEQLFSGGLVALALLLLSFFVTFRLGWKNGASRELGLLIFFIIYGATEPIINGPVSFPVFVMYLAVARIISPAAVTAPIVKRSDGSIAALAGAAGR